MFSVGGDDDEDDVLPLLNFIDIALGGCGGCINCRVAATDFVNVVYYDYNGS